MVDRMQGGFMRGLEEQHELSPQLLLRDTRTLGMKIVDFFKDPIK